MEEQIKSVVTDVNDVKSDVREIKNALTGGFVTKDEFVAYKNSQVVQKLLLSVLNLFIGALIGAELAIILK